MIKTCFRQFKAYFFLSILLASIILGSLTGHWLGSSAQQLKPLGDIFLNLIFTLVTPLVFFSMASAIAKISDAKQVWKIIYNTLGVFLLTGLIAAIYMIVIVKIFPPAQDVFFKTAAISNPNSAHHLGTQIANILTVPDFVQLFSKQNMLALIVFAMLFGFSVAATGEKGKSVQKFLESGTEVTMKAVYFVMYCAPIGFFAYFAVLTADLGPKLLESYLRASIIYCGAAIVYFTMAFSFYAWLAGGKAALNIFWKNIPLPFMTALATCSSAASIPTSLQSTRNMHVPVVIYETVIPLGAILHKDGSVLGGVLKIAFLFGIFHLNFSGFIVLLSAVFIGILVGTVMGAIPSGGMIAELLILSLYGFPPEALIMIAPISILIDAPATVLNVTGNSVCSMLIARLVSGREWYKFRT